MTDPSLSKKGSRRSDGSLIKADGEHGSYGLAVFCLYGSSLTGYDHARQCKPNPKAFTVGMENFITPIAFYLTQANGFSSKRSYQHKTGIIKLIATGRER